MEFLENNSYYSDQDLYAESCFFNPYLPSYEHPTHEWTHEDFSRVLNEFEDAMLVNLCPHPQKLSVDTPPDQYSEHPMATGFSVIPSNFNNYNGGWACEELGRVVNEIEEGMLMNPYQQPQQLLNDPSPNQYCEYSTPADVPLIPFDSYDYSDGWTYGESWRVVNEMGEEILVNPSDQHPQDLFIDASSDQYSAYPMPRIPNAQHESLNFML